MVRCISEKKLGRVVRRELVYNLRMYSEEERTIINMKETDTILQKKSLFPGKQTTQNEFLSARDPENMHPRKNLKTDFSSASNTRCADVYASFLLLAAVFDILCQRENAVHIKSTTLPCEAILDTNSITATQRAYQREFGVRNPPKRNIILGLVNKLESTGSLVSEKGKHRSSRLPTVVVDVRARLEQSPKKSLRFLSQETGYTYSMCQRP
ncbi:hypothetical protein ANN_05524 [Periplaneta americana]|uniref:DUF4817 domain-containing protein n=1 Tax=Periplaneta americana TaxID=6978 RepID=A0ABQ8TCS6_PERAM|nr:hypothetical protein ANN_05524 [Periplaneta americana]